MKLINRENGEELVEVGSHKDYASKGVAGTGLGLGIAGTALWLLSGGLGGGLFGNRFGAAGAAALGAESTVEKEDKCELVIGKVNQALSIIADENGMIDADGILNDMIDNLIISPVKEERGIKIGAGTVEIKIPFINKAIALDKDDINEFKEMLSKIQQ
jgi:hypothetical protein